MDKKKTKDKKTKKTKAVRSTKSFKKEKAPKVSKVALSNEAKAVEEQEITKRDSLLKLFIPMGLGVIAVAILLILGISNFKFEFNLEEDGYAIPTTTVLSTLDTSSQESAPLYKFKTGDSIYSQNGNLGKHFIGEEKEGISARFPMYTRNGQVLYFIDDSTPIITNEWTTLDSYEGLRLSDGETFNADNSRADLDEIILVDVDYGYQVAQETKISTDYSSKTIAMNTICEFGESRIDCFEYNNGHIDSYAINVGRGSNISIGDNKYTYEEFLQNIGVWKKNEGIDDNTVVTTADEAEQQGNEGKVAKKKERDYKAGDLPIKKENTGVAEHAKAADNTRRPAPPKDPVIPDWQLPVVTIDETTINPWVYFVGMDMSIDDPAHVIDAKGVKISGQSISGDYPNGDYTINKTKSPRISTGISGQSRLSQVIPDTWYVISYEYTYTEAYGSQRQVSRYLGVDYVEIDKLVENNDIYNVNELIYDHDASGNRIADPESPYGYKTTTLHDSTGKLKKELLGAYKSLGYDQLNPIEVEFNSNFEDLDVFYQSFQIGDIYYPNMVDYFKQEGQSRDQAIEEAKQNQILPGDEIIRTRTPNYEATETYITSFRIEYVKGDITPTAEGDWPESVQANAIKSVKLNNASLDLLNKGFVMDYYNVGDSLSTNTTYTYRIVLKDKFDHEFVYTGTNHYDGGKNRSADSLHPAKTCKKPPFATISVPNKTNRGNKVTVNVKIDNIDLCDITQGPEDNFLFLTKYGEAIVPENALEVTYVLVDEDGNELSGQITSKKLPVSTANDVTTTSFKIVGGLDSQTAYHAGVFCTSYDMDDGHDHLNEILEETTTFTNGSLSSYGTVQYSGYADNINHRRADVHMRMSYNKAQQLFEYELLPLLSSIEVNTSSLGYSRTFKLKKADLEAVPVTFEETDIYTINGISYRDIQIPVHIEDSDDCVLVDFTLAYPADGLPKNPIDDSDPTNVWDFILATSNCNGAAYFTTRVSQYYEVPDGVDIEPGQLVTLEKSTDYKVALKFIANNGSTVFEDVTSPSSKPIAFSTLKVEPYASFADVFISDTFIELYNLSIVDPDETISEDKAGSGNALIKLTEAKIKKDSTGAEVLDPEGNPVIVKSDKVVDTKLINTSDYPLRDVSDTGTNPTIRFGGLTKDKYYVLEIIANEYTNGNTYENFQLMLVLGDTLSIIDQDIFVREYYFNTNGKIVGNINIESLYRSYKNGSTETSNVGLLGGDDWTLDEDSGAYVSKHIDIDEYDADTIPMYSIFSSFKTENKTSANNLPSYFQEVDYIQSNGTQYIKTGYYHNDKTELYVEFMPIRKANTWNALFGSRTATIKEDAWDIGYNDGTGFFFLNTKFDNKDNIYELTDFAHFISLRLNRDQLIIDEDVIEPFTETQYVEQNATIGTAVYEDYLFAINQNGSAVNLARNKVRKLQIIEDGLVLMNFVPCYAVEDVPAYMVNNQKRAKAGTAGLYDTVGKKFYVSADANSNFGYSGGDQEPEPYELPEGIKEIEYIEAIGTQYIDTGYYHDFNTVVDAVVLPKKGTNTWNAIFGARTATKATDTLDFGYNDSTSYNSYFLNNTNGDWNNVVEIKDYSSWNTIHLDSYTMSVDGISAKTGANGNVGSAVYSDFLFQINTANNPVSNHWARIQMKSFKISNYSTGEIYRNFVPVITTKEVSCKATGYGIDTTGNRRVNRAGEYTGDNVTIPAGIRGLYDTVNGVFYRSAADNNFDGPEQGSAILPSKYEEVKFLGSSGVQWINTGDYADGNTISVFNFSVYANAPNNAPRSYKKGKKWYTAYDNPRWDHVFGFRDSYNRNAWKYALYLKWDSGNFYPSYGNYKTSTFTDFDTGVYAVHDKIYNVVMNGGEAVTSNVDKDGNIISPYDADNKTDKGLNIYDTTNNQQVVSFPYTLPTTGNPTKTYTIEMFNLNDDGNKDPNGGNNGHYKFYNCKIYHKNTSTGEYELSRDFVPVIAKETIPASEVSTGISAPATTPGMYDMVHGIFYVNNGSGTFTYQRYVADTETSTTTGRYTVSLWENGNDTPLKEYNSDLLGNGNIFKLPEEYANRDDLYLTVSVHSIPDGFTINDVKFDKFDESIVYNQPVDTGEGTVYVGDNLLADLSQDNNDFIDGYMYDTQGNRVTTEGMAVTTAFTEIKPDSVYFAIGLNDYNTANGQYYRTTYSSLLEATSKKYSSSTLVTYYNDKKEYISSAYIGSQGSLFKTPTNAAYMRFNIRGDVYNIPDADVQEDSELRLGVPYNVNSYGTRYTRTGDKKSDMYISFKPTVTGNYTFYSSNVVSGDPYMYICDEDKTPLEVEGVVLANDDGDGNLNFKMSVDLEGGKTYYINPTHSNMAISSQIEYNVTVTDSKYTYKPESFGLYLYTPADEEKFTATFSGDVLQYDDELKDGLIQIKLYMTKEKVTISTNLDEFTDDQWRDDYRLIYKRPNDETTPAIGPIEEIENTFENITVNVDAGYGYKAELYATKAGRTAEILLDSINFTAVQPVYVIKDIPTLKKVASDMAGYYICISDIPAATDSGYVDFTVSDELFTGVIDWQGHTVNLSTSKPLFDRLGNDSVMRNGNFVYEEQRSDVKPFATNYIAENDVVYYEVEYIESTGSQWINTGVVFDQNKAEIKFKMMPTSIKTTGNYFYGCSGSPWFSFEHYNGQPYWNIGSTTGWGKHAAMAVNKTYEYDVKYNNGSISSTGSYNGSGSYGGTIVSPHPLAFFTNSVNGTAYSCEKLYYLKVWSGDTLVRDFVPVVCSEDNRAGLWDKQQNRFYPNNGTGSFKYGKILEGDEHIYRPEDAGAENEKFIKLEYIESTGNQYLVIDKNQGKGTDYEIKFERTDKNNTEQDIIGCNNGNGDMLNINLLNDGVTAKAYITNGRTYTISDLDLNKPVVYKLQGTLFTIDDGHEHSVTITRDNYSSTSRVTIFAANGGGATPAYGKLYYAKIYQDGLLVFDGVPAMATEEIPEDKAFMCGRNIAYFGNRAAPAGTVGLYDKQSGNFYYSYVPLKAPSLTYSDDTTAVSKVFDKIDLNQNYADNFLPSDLLELEYISSNKLGQRINTGLKGSQSYWIQMIASKNTTYGCIGSPFGAGQYQWQNTGLHINLLDTYYWFYCGGMNQVTSYQDKLKPNQSYYFNTYRSGNTRYIYIYSDPDHNYSTSTLLTSTSANMGRTDITGDPIYLFGASSNRSGDDRYGYMNLYACKMYDTYNGTLIRNFIPCIAKEDIDGSRTWNKATLPAGTVGLYDTVNGVFYSSINAYNFEAPTTGRLYYYEGTDQELDNTACIARENYGTLTNMILHYGPATASAYPVSKNSAAMVVNNYGTIDTFSLEYTANVNVKSDVGGVCLHNYGTISNGYIVGKQITDANGNETTAGLTHRYKTISSVYVVNSKKKTLDDPDAETPTYHYEDAIDYVFERTGNETKANNISYVAAYNENHGVIKNVYVAADLRVESENAQVGENGNWTYGLSYAAPGLLQVDSITSTGTQYFNTGLNMKALADNMGTEDTADDIEGFSAEMKIKFNGFSGACQEIIGGHNYNSNSTYNNGSKGWHNTYLRTNAGGKLVLGFREADNYNVAMSIGTLYTIDMSTLDKNAYLDINGTRVWSSTLTATQVDGPIGLFCGLYPNGTPIARNPYAQITMYYCKVYAATGDLVADYVPCVAAENIDGSRTNTGNGVLAGTAGMYDRVSEKFFVSLGTNDFVGSGQFDKTALDTDYSALITGYNNGSIKNSFSSGDILDINYSSSEKGLVISDSVVMRRIGPAIGANFEGYDISNVNYVSTAGVEYSNALDSASYMHSYNESSEIKSLHDYKWYEDKLGKDGTKFNIRNFVVANYYPQLIMSDYLAAEDIPSLKLPDSEQLLAILGSEIRQRGTNQYGEQTVVATLLLDNPINVSVQDVNIVDTNGTKLDTEVIAQGLLDGIYRIDVLITYNDKVEDAPLAERSYTIKSYNTVSAQNRQFAKLSGEDIINLDFYHEVKNVSEWGSALGNATSTREFITENYRIIRDIDFSNSDTYNDWLVTADFRGELDGGEYDVITNVPIVDYLGQITYDINHDQRFINIKGDLIGLHTISGIGNVKNGAYAAGRGWGDVLKSVDYNYTDENSARFSLFRMVSGNISNIIFKDFETVKFDDVRGFSDVTNSICGVIARTSMGATIDNCHVRDSAFNSRGYCGALIGYANNTIIRNSSVKDSTLKGTNYPLCYDATYLGGLVGYGYNLDVSNCFVSNTMITGTNIGTLAGAGGIVGVTEYSNIFSSYVGSGTINISGNCVGGIVGKVGSTAQTANNDYNFNTTIENCWTSVAIQSNGDFVGGIAGYMGIYSGSEDKPNGNKMLRNYTSSTILSMDYSATHVNRINCFDFENVNYYYNNFAFENQSLNYKNSKSTTASGTYQFGPTNELNGASRLLSPSEIRSSTTWIGEMGFDENSYYFEEIEAKELMPKLFNSNTGELLYDQADELLGTKDTVKIEVLSAENQVDNGKLKIKLRLWNYGWDQDTYMMYSSPTKGTYTQWLDLADWENLAAVGGSIDLSQASSEYPGKSVRVTDKIVPLDNSVEEGGYYGIDFVTYVNYTDPELGHYSDSYLISVPVYLSEPETDNRMLYNAYALIVLDEDNVCAKVLRNARDWNEFFSASGTHYNSLEVIKIASPGIFNFSDTDAGEPARNAGIDKIYNALTPTDGDGGRPLFTGIIKYEDISDASFISEISGDVNGLTFRDFTIDYNNTTSTVPQGLIGTLSAGLNDIRFNNVTIKNTQGTSTGLIGQTTVGAYLNNINIKDVNIIAGANKANVGGLVGQLVGSEAHYTTAKNITVDNIRVTSSKIDTATSKYGGLFGYSKYAEIEDINIKDSKPITSKYKDTALYGSDYNYFQEVEYVESTSDEQWINTGVKQTSTLEVKVEVEFTQKGANRIFGAINGSSHYYQLGNDDANKWKAQSGPGGKEIWPAVPMDFQKHIAGINANNKSAFFENENGVRTNYTMGTFTVDTAVPIYLFGLWGSTKSAARLYSATFTDGPTVIRQYVPVITKMEVPADKVAYHVNTTTYTDYDTNWNHPIPKNTAGLYDTVNELFYPIYYVNGYPEVTAALFAGPKVGVETDGSGYDYNRIEAYNMIGGVVGHAEYSTIRDIDLQSVLAKGVYQFVGGIVGRADNCKFENLVSHYDEASTSYKPNTCTNIYADAANNCIGGLIGCSYTTKGLDNVFDNAIITDMNVLGYSYVGGIIGYIQSWPMSLRNLDVHDIRVVNRGSYAAGCIGQTSGMVVSMSNCKYKDINVSYSKANVGVSGENKSGGVIGFIENSDSFTCENVDASDIYARASRYVGGFVGQIENKQSKKYNVVFHNCHFDNFKVVQQYLDTNSGIVGGVVGEVSYMNAYGDDGTTITNMDVVSNAGIAGGFVGYMYQATDYADRFIGSQAVSTWSEDSQEYKKLKYISSTGSQYINTGVIPDSKTRVEVIAECDTGTSIFGIHATNQYFNYTANATYNIIRLGSKTKENMLPLLLGKYTKIDFWKGVDRYTQDAAGNWVLQANGSNTGDPVAEKAAGNMFHKGDLVDAMSCDFPPTTLPIFLFARNYNNGINDAMTGKIYECKIWQNCTDGENGTLVRHFIPVQRTIDSVNGMLDITGTAYEAGTSDIITGTFYPNKGSGAFNAGYIEESAGDYTDLEYLQSNGTQWIDTGVAIEDGDEAKGIKFEFDAIVYKQNFCRVFGFYSSDISSRLLLQSCASNGYELYFASGSKRVSDNKTIYGQKQHYEVQVKSGNTYVKIDGQEVLHNDSTVSLSHGPTIGLFNLLTSSHTLFNDNNNKGLTLYNMKITKGDEVVRDYKPVKRNSDETFGMLDIHDENNKVFYGSSSATVFTPGYKGNSSSEGYNHEILKIDGVHIRTYGHYVGGVMGRTGQVGNDPYTVQNCKVDNVVIEVLRNSGDIQDIGGAAGNCAAIHDVVIGNKQVAENVSVPGAGGSVAGVEHKPSVVITGNSTYHIGGAVGLLGIGNSHNANVKESYNVEVYNAKLESWNLNRDRIGGIAGYVYSNDVHDCLVENVTINGCSCDGGIVGFRPNRSETFNLTYNNTVKDSIITGYNTDAANKDYEVTDADSRGVGGIVGFHMIENVHAPIYGNTVENCVLASNMRIGGIVGATKYTDVYDNKVIDTTILSTTGRSVGGVVGYYPTTKNYLRSIYRNVVEASMDESTGSFSTRSWSDWSEINDKLTQCCDETYKFFDKNGILVNTINTVKTNRYDKINERLTKYQTAYDNIKSKISNVGDYPMAVLGNVSVAGDFSDENVGGIVGNFHGMSLHDCYVGNKVLVATVDTYSTSATNKANVSTGGLIGYTTAPVDASNTGYLTDYIELEYIEATGQSWINPGYTVNTSTKVEFKYLPNPSSGNTNGNWFTAIFGGAWSGNQFLLDTQSNKLYFHAPGTVLWSSINNRYPLAGTIYKQGTNVYLDVYEDKAGGRHYTNPSAPLSDTYLGALYILHAGANKYNAEGKLYYFRIYDGETIVRDMIPVVRRADGEVGMYDKVNHTFYGSAGTGKFVAGYSQQPVSNINEYKTYTRGSDTYEAVDYVLSDGALSIDTGIKPTNEIEWELDYQFVNKLGKNTSNHNEDTEAQVGTGPANDKQRFLVYESKANATYMFGIGKTYDTTIPIDYRRHLFTMDVHGTSFKIDDNNFAYADQATKDATKSALTLGSNPTIRLFTRDTQNTNHAAKLYSSKITDYVKNDPDDGNFNEVVLQHLVPVRKVAETYNDASGVEQKYYTYYLLDIKDVNEANEVPSDAKLLTATGLSGGYDGANVGRNDGVTTDQYIYDCVVGANVLSTANANYQSDAHTAKEATGGIIGCYGLTGYSQKTASAKEIMENHNGGTAGVAGNTMHIYNGRDVNLLKGPNAQSIYNFLFTGSVSANNNASFGVGGAVVTELSSTTIGQIENGITNGEWIIRGDSDSPDMLLYYNKNGAASTNPITITTENVFYKVSDSSTADELTTNEIAKDTTTGNPILYLNAYTTARHAGVGRLRVSASSEIHTVNSSGTYDSNGLNVMTDSSARTYETITAVDPTYDYIAGYSVSTGTLTGDDAVKGKFYYGKANTGSMELGSRDPRSDTETYKSTGKWWNEILGGTKPVTLTAPAPKLKLNSVKVQTDAAKLIDQMIVYSSGIDTFNIELPTLPGDSVDYKITTLDSTISGTWPSNQKTMSFSFDYNSGVTIELKCGDDTCEKTLRSKDIARTVMTYGNSYWYLYNGKAIDSHKRSINDNVTFIHMYDGKLLDSNGNIYSASNGSPAGTARTLSRIEAKPLWSGMVNTDGQTHLVKTFATYSLSDDMNINARLYVKNSTLFTLSTSENIVGGPVVDVYGDKLYATVLVKTNELVNLGSKLYYPENFKTYSIKEISNTVNYTGHYMLVRYTDDTLVIFDYMNGTAVDALYVQPSIVQSFGSFLKDSLKKLTRPSSAGEKESGIISDAHKYENTVSQSPSYQEALKELDKKIYPDYDTTQKDIIEPEKSDETVIVENDDLHEADKTIIGEKDTEHIGKPDSEDSLLENTEYNDISDDREFVDETNKHPDTKDPKSSEDGSGVEVYDIKNSYVALFNEENDKAEIYDASDILSKPIEECVSEEEKAAMLEKLGLKTIIPAREQVSQNTANGIMLIVLIVFALVMLISILFYIRRRNFAENRGE